MKNFGFKEKTIEMDSLNSSIVVVYGKHKNLEAYIRKRFDDKDFELKNDFATGKFIWRKGYCPVIWLPNKPTTPYEYGVVAHECSHAIIYLFGEMGTNVNMETNEIFAYALERLMNKII